MIVSVLLAFSLCIRRSQQEAELVMYISEAVEN